MSKTKALATREQLVKDGIQLEEQVGALKITSQAKYLEMEMFFTWGKGRLDMADAFMEPMRVKSYAAYQEVLESKRILRAPFEKAVKLARQRIKGWDELEAEKARQAQAARVAAERAAEEAARAAKKAGEAPPPPPPAPRPRENRAEQGTLTWVDNWKSGNVDMVALVKAAAKNPALMIYLAPNRQELDKFAKRTVGDVEVPGVEWKNDRVPKR